MNRWWPLLSLVAAGCTCGALDPNARFACVSDDDCVAGFVCAPVQGAKECVAAAPADAGRDAGVDAGTIDAGIDRDRDGFPLPGDCDDTDPAINPGAIESCTNGRDDDCDTLTDCEAAECNGAACAGGGTCISFVCRASTEVLCSDGLDNDGDGRIDCADSECPVGISCTDSNGCTQGDRCVADGGCEKLTDLTCTTPPGTCFNAAGVCQPDAGASCLYTPRPGSCDDGLGCTTTDTCSAGVCGGTAVSCTTPPSSCFAAAGNCQEPSGTCRYTPLTGSACSDGQNCSINDTCDGDGGCRGTFVSCVAPSQCHVPTGACTADGGCVFAPRTGLSCDAGTAGTCSATFNCVANPTSLFPYTPSNFTESQLPMADGGAFIVNCNATLDTTALTLTSGCGVLPPFALIVPDGGESTVLFKVDSLVVLPSGSLTIVGSRPVIFAALGDIAIEGLVTASNGAGTSSACGTGGAGAGILGGALSGGGGGGFGSVGGRGGSTFSASGGSGGNANGSAPLLPLRGGCNGGTSSVAGGAGGGALQLSAAGTLVIDAIVSAPGKGAVNTVGTQQSGGGGGGSGGAILLEGRTVTVTSGSVLAANGGGGAEGGSNGLPGADGVAGAAAALGGAGGSNGGGNGGNGAAALLAALDGQASGGISNGGGGGGGGVGRIRINASQSCTVGGIGTVLSPPATSNGANGCP